jgi:hypothetical protein
MTNPNFRTRSRDSAPENDELDIKACYLVLVNPNLNFGIIGAQDVVPNLT